MGGVNKAGRVWGRFREEEVYIVKNQRKEP